MKKIPAADLEEVDILVVDMLVSAAPSFSFVENGEFLRLLDKICVQSHRLRQLSPHAAYRA